MKKFTILIPIFNDWESLEKLLNRINENIKDIKEAEFDCVIIDDCSSIKNPKIEVPPQIKLIKIIHMNKNRGHARCNAFGIKYLSENKNLDYLILMDGDGEDRPEEIKLLVAKVLSEPNKSVVAKRIKRSEGFLFQMLYRMHKWLTLLTTGKMINFGNYSCLTQSDIKKISTKASLWSSYTGTFKKYIKNYNQVNSIRGTRYFGPSKMNFMNLIKHSLSIISVFRKTFLIRSALFIVIYILLIKSNASITTSVPLILLLIAVYSVSNLALRENMEEFKNSLSQIKDIEQIK